jgi:hypothetical protein
MSGIKVDEMKVAEKSFRGDGKKKKRIKEERQGRNRLCLAGAI